ncbi:MAG: peptidoglycan/xylan/chitin deacetylase (PgdA/CDA1 family) [Paracoccaceae bacterium]|jgi:peptidoglycan/xylan/chitin deacetylase (PgdA/CDA1 family)
MIRPAFALLAMGAILFPIQAQEVSDLETPTPPAVVAEPPVLFEDDGSRVAILGYHEFHATQKATQMRIPTAKFREQMKAIQDSNIPVITMGQFLSWRRGESGLPAQSIMITMDDGWKSVYTQAFPVMREFQLPFSIFLYKNYVGSNRGGRAMSLAMINEMVDSGLCNIGSHSVSHPRPSVVKKSAGKGPAAYDQFLRTELGESQSFLEETFKTKVTTYAYPGGYYTDEMFTLANEFGYDHLFTVKPGKVRRNSPSHTLSRYIVLGNHDGAFNAAMVFRNGARVAASPTLLPHPTQPRSGDIVESRLPVIKVDLSGVEDLDPDSVVMRVAGFDKVPVQMNPGTQVFQWTVSRPLRQPMCEVTTQWRLKSKEDYEPVMRWSFRVDHEAAYQAQ